MAQYINTNTASISGQQYLAKSQASLQTSMQRLSSGMRINSAKDDAAGLAIADKMTSQINGANQAARNANDAASLVQTTDGALGSITSALQSIRQLAVQAASDTNSSSDRANLGAQAGALASEIDRISGSTTFNGVNLTNTSSSLTFQIGSGTSSNDTISLTLTDASFSTIATSTGISLTSSSFTGASGSFTTSASAQSVITAVDAALTTVSTARAGLGAIANRLDTAVSNLQTTSTNLTAARSQVQDTDFAAETANMTRAQILQQAGTAMLSQANSAPNGIMKLLG